MLGLIQHLAWKYVHPCLDSLKSYNGLWEIITCRLSGIQSQIQSRKYNSILSFRIRETDAGEGYRAVQEAFRRNKTTWCKSKRYNKKTDLLYRKFLKRHLHHKAQHLYWNMQNFYITAWPGVKRNLWLHAICACAEWYSRSWVSQAVAVHWDIKYAENCWLGIKVQD